MPLDITNWKTPASIFANVLAMLVPEHFQLGTNLFIGFMPDTTNNCFCLIDSGGGEQDPVNNIDDISFQVFSRHIDYQTGYNLQNLIKSTFQSMEPTILDDEIILGTWVKSNIVALGRDESERSLFSSNYRAKIETQKDTNRNGEMQVLTINMSSFIAALNIPSYANLAAANLALAIGKIYYDESLSSLEVTTG